MKPKLIELIADPVDGGKLTIADGADRDGEGILTGTLRSENGREYPIRDGVPRLVPGDQELSLSQEGTADTFGSKWSLLDDQEIATYDEWALQWYADRYGWSGEEEVREFLSGQDTILDAGTGTGRHVAMYAEAAPGAEVVGFDISDSVTDAQKRFGSLPNAHFVQGDILQPPLAHEFSFVASDQVIHHTPDAPAAFAELARLLRARG